MPYRLIPINYYKGLAMAIDNAVAAVGDYADDNIMNSGIKAAVTRASVIASGVGMKVLIPTIKQKILQRSLNKLVPRIRSRTSLQKADGALLVANYEVYAGKPHYVILNNVFIAQIGNQARSIYKRVCYKYRSEARILPQPQRGYYWVSVFIWASLK